MLTANIQKYATDLHTNANVLLLAIVHMDMYGIEFSANAFGVWHAAAHQDTTLIIVSVDVCMSIEPPTRPEIP